MDEFQCMYDRMEELSKSFNTQAEVVQQMLQNLTNHMEDLKPDWIGKGSDAFFNEMESEVLPALQRLQVALEDGGQMTARVNQVVETAEQQAQAQFTYLA